MKIDLISDIHLEFGFYKPTNPSQSDVLIMAGDVVPYVMFKDPIKGPKLVQFFETCTEMYRDVIYIFGNHEFYQGDMAEAFGVVQEHLNHLQNLHILNNEQLKIDDVVFLGGTMWTDCNREDPMTMLALTQSMNDYHVISNSNKVSHYSYNNIIDPEDTVAEFKKFKSFLIKALGEFRQEKCVVVTHHLPSFRAIPEEYRYDREMNGGYASNLDEFILNRPQIKYWVFGHTHHPQQFTIGDTQLLNNARGYVNVERLDDDLDPYLPVTFEV